MLSVYTPLFFFNDTATTEIYTLSLHDALPISKPVSGSRQFTDTCRVAGSPADPSRTADQNSLTGRHTSWMGPRRCRPLVRGYSRGSARTADAAELGARFRRWDQ